MKQTTIRVIPWDFKSNSPCKDLNSRTPEIEQNIEDQVTKALIKVNNSLNINLRLAEIYYDLRDDLDEEGVYQLLLIRLVQHFFETNELELDE
jgi:hypothetical protein